MGRKKKILADFEQVIFTYARLVLCCAWVYCSKEGLPVLCVVHAIPATRLIRQARGRSALQRHVRFLLRLWFSKRGRTS